MTNQGFLRLAYQQGMKLALATKTFGPFTFKLDRPKGFVKTWKQPDGSEKKYTYPVDYGYLIRHTGEDGEGLDFFVGDDATGPVESFMKMKPGPSGMVEDETKFLIGLTPSERKKVLALYSEGELRDHKVYKNIYDLTDKLKTFKNTKKASLEKIALPRWQQELAKGTLGAAEKARLRIPESVTGTLEKGLVSKLRNRLWRPSTDLNAAQLANHRNMKALQTSTILPQHGIALPDELVRSVGPAGVLNGNLFMSKSPTTDIYSFLGSGPKKLPEHTFHKTAPTLNNAFLHHELAEQAMSQGIGNQLISEGFPEASKMILPRTTDDLKPIQEQLYNGGIPDLANILKPIQTPVSQSYEPKPFASHLGPAAILAENMQMHRDPAAQHAMSRLRTLQPDEQVLAKKIRQYGGTPSAPIPLGGKGHRRLEEDAVNLPIGEAAKLLRLQTPTSPITQKLYDETENTFKGLKNTMPQEQIPYLDHLLNEVKERAGVRHRVPNEREQLMALLSSPRRDAIP